MESTTGVVGERKMSQSHKDEAFNKKIGKNERLDKVDDEEIKYQNIEDENAALEEKM